MRLLHLHWLTPVHQEQDGRLFIWAETDALGRLSSQSRSKRAQPHPRVADVQTLRQLIATARLPGASLAESLALWLPTNRLGPLPPPDLGHNWETDDDQPTLRRWAING